MGLSLLESLRRLVRQDLHRVSRPVGNLHGAVASTLEALESAPSQSWLVLRTEGVELPSLEEFYQRYDLSDSTMMTVESAVDGSSVVSVPVGQVAVARTVVTVTRAQTVNLELVLDTTTSGAAVYLNGVLQRRVEGPTARVPLTLTPGAHTLAVVLKTPRVQLTMPSNLALSGLLEQLPTPQWRSVSTGYLDAQAGTAANILEWVADPQAGGYRVLRRTVRYIMDPTVANNGQILEVGALNSLNQFLLVLEGNQTARLAPGDPLVLNSTTIGLVVDTTLSGTNTEVLCRLPAGATVPTSTVLGQFCTSGRLQELVRVAQETTMAPVVQYRDAQVSYGETYEYALQSYGLVDPTVLSPLSTVVLLRAGDMSPPAPVVFLPDYPKVLNRIATVKFTTPDDEDYQGVRVYFRDRVFKVDEEPFLVQSYSTGNKQITVQGGVDLPASLQGFFVKFGTSPVPYAVVSSTSNTIVLSSGPAVAPTAGTTVTLYKDVLLKTDFGSPDREDELSVELPEYGLYYFSAFDRANNEQAFDVATQWTYTPDADGFAGPPVMAIRQLTTQEQEFFFLSALGTVSVTTGGVATFSAAQQLEVNRKIRIGTATYAVVSGNNTSYQLTPNPAAAITNQTFQLNCTDFVQYVVLELWAYDPSKSENTKYNGVTLYYQRVGSDASPIAMTPIPSQLEAFPNTVATETVTKPVTTTLSSTTATTASTIGLKQGMVLSGNPNLPANTTIASVINTTSVQLSAAATGGASNVSTTFTYSTDLQAIFDNPPTTRSRFVLVNRDYPQVQVWAENEQGQTSDIATYYADHDSTPEVVIDTTINPTNNTFTAVVVADDDTAAFTWKVDDGSVYTVDTTSNKRSVLSPALSVANGRDSTSLGLGERRELTITPYGRYVNGVPSQPGIAVVRELIRTPRSSVTFENRDADGDRSATSVTATFSMVPAPTLARNGAVVYQNRNATLARVSNEWILTDTTTNPAPGFVTTPAPQFLSNITRYHYAVLKRPNTVPIVARITGNTSTTLKLEQVERLGEITSAVTYDIVDGAVLYRRISGTNPTPVPTSGVEIFSRVNDAGLGSAFELEFYATKNNCYPENPRRVLVDADQLPRFTNFKYKKRDLGGGLVYLDLGFDSADDDATTWEVYERKVQPGGPATWPTVTGNAISLTAPPTTNSLDRQYLRFAGPVEQTSYSRLMPTASGTWYAIAVPYNAYGEPGLASTDTYAIGSSTPFQLADMFFTPSIGTSNVSIAFSTSGTAGSGTVNVVAVRRDSPTTSFSATGTTNGATLNIVETTINSGGAQRIFDVTATLVGGNTISRSFTVNVATPSDNGGGSAPTVTINGSVAVTREGACFGALTEYPNCAHYLSSSQIRSVSWNVVVNGQTVTSFGSPYFVRVEVARDVGSTSWTLIADGVPAAQQGYDHITDCLYEDLINGTLEYWRYRLTVTDAAGTTTVTSGQTNQLARYVRYCGGGGADS